MSAIERRAELMMALDAERVAKDAGLSGPNGPSKPRQHRATGRARGPEPIAVGSRNLAKLQGVSPTTVKRATRRAAALGTETLECVTRTSLDKPRELDALAKLPEAQREEVIAKAEAEAVKPEAERVQLLKDMAARDKAVRAVEREAAKGSGLSGPNGPLKAEPGKRNRPLEAASERDLSAKTGISKDRAGGGKR